VGGFRGLKRRKHAGEDLEAEIFFVFQTVGETLKHSDFVVQAFDEAQRNLVLGFAVSRDTLLAPIDHLGKGFVRFEVLPLEARTPSGQGA